MTPEETVNQLNGLLTAVTHGILGVHSVHQGGWGTEMEKPHQIAIQGKVMTAYFSVPEIANKFEDDEMSAIESERVLATALIGNSAEILKQCEIYDTELSQYPEIQFLRWCRNAAFHGNHFNVQHALDKPAEWRGLVISEELHGTPIMPDFIMRGDAIFLIRDTLGIIDQYIS